MAASVFSGISCYQVWSGVSGDGHASLPRSDPTKPNAFPRSACRLSHLRHGMLRRHDEHDGRADDAFVNITTPCRQPNRENGGYRNAIVSALGFSFFSHAGCARSEFMHFSKKFSIATICRSLTVVLVCCIRAPRSLARIYSEAAVARNRGCIDAPLARAGLCATSYSGNYQM